MSSFRSIARGLFVASSVTSAVIAAVFYGAVTRAEYEPAGFFAPGVTATKSDAFATDTDTDGRADPGDVIRYTVQVNNAGVSPADDATGVNFTDTIDLNTTLVGGSVASSAVAVNDLFPVTVVGNVGINSATITGGPYSVVSNDYLGTNPLATIASFDAVSANGGNVAMIGSGAGIGQFTYDPPAGFTGTDTFTYTLADNAGAPSAVGNRTGTVSITITGMVWFINNGASACTTAASNCGRLSSPYSTLAAFEAENGDADVPATDDWFPAAGDNIFVYESATAYAGGVTLLANQRFIGQDADASLSSITGLTPPVGSPSFPAMNLGAPATTITNAAGNGITLNNNNTVRGLTVSGASASGIAGVAATNTAIIAGNNDVTITGTTGVAAGNGALAFNGGNGAVTFSGTISGNTGDAVNIRNRTGGITTIQGPVTSTTRGVVLDNNDGASILFTAGLSLSTGTNAAFTAINGGTVVATQNNSTVVNTLATTTGTPLNVANTTIGASGLTFRSISANGATNGIVLNNTGASGGLTVTGNSSGLCGGSVNTATEPDTITAPNTADCTGGTLQNISGGDAISLTSAANVSLTRMRLLNVSGVNNSGIDANNLGGSNYFLNGNMNNVSAAGTNGSAISVINTNTTLTLFSVENSYFANSTSGTSHVFSSARGTGNMNVDVRTSLFENLVPLAVQINAGDAEDQAHTVTSNIIGNVFRNASAADGQGGLAVINAEQVATHNTTVSNNTFQDLIKGIAGGNAEILLAQTVGGALNGTISGNVLGNATAGNGDRRGIGVIVEPDVSSNGELGSIDLIIENNTIDRLPGREGIFVDIREDATNSELIIRNNSIGNLAGFLGQVGGNGATDREAIDVQVRGETAKTFNLLMTGNNVRSNTTFPTGNVNLEVNNDAGSEAAAISLQATVTSNTLINAGGFPELTARTRGGDTGGSICLDMNGNTLDAGAGQIQLNEDGGPVNVEQASQAALATANGIPSGNVIFTGSPNYGVGCSAPPVGFAPPAEETAVRDPYQESIDKHNALIAELEAMNSPQVAAETPKVVELESGILQTISSIASRIFSAIVPTASAQEVTGDRVKPLAPASGETVSVGPIATLPASKSVTITFNVTVDPLDPAEIRTRILNQGTVTGSNFANALTSDPTPSTDPACTAPPPLGGATCTPVDRPDTSVTSVDRDTTSPTNAASVSWTVTFADAIAGLTAANLTLSDTTTSCSGEAITTVLPVGGGPAATQWTVTANTGTGSCTLRLDVSNDGGISHDLTNDPFVSGHTIVVDKTPPSTTSFTRQVPATSPTNADTLTFRVTFSENVTGVGAGDFTVSGTTATVTGIVGVTPGPAEFSVYDVTVSGGDLANLNGTVGLNFNAAAPAGFITDIAGNFLPNAEPAIDQTYLVDNTAPTVDIVDVTPDPRNTNVTSVAINFSENVSNFDIADLTLTRDGGGNLLPGGATISGGPQNYTLNLTAGETGTDGSYLLTLTAAGSGIVDAAGNAIAIGATDSWVRDAVAPTVTINQAAGQNDPTFQNPINFTAVFNEAVTDFDDAADVVVTGTAPGVGTATVLITPNSATNYTVSISGITGDGTVIANIPANVAVDQAGNSNVASTSTDNTVTFITCVPPPPNMRAWYTGDGTASDIAGGHDGSFTGNTGGGDPSYSPGKVGDAFDFDGADDIVTAPGNTGLNISGNGLTMDGWIYPRANVSGTFYFAKSALSDHPYVLYNSGGDVHGIIRTPVNNFEYDTNFTPPLNTWTHIALVFDSTQAVAADRVKIYINGTAATLFAPGGFPAQNSNLASSTLPFGIGNRVTNPSAVTFDGLIDEVEVFDRGLSAAEIQAIVSADGGGKCKPSDLNITKTDGGSGVVPGGTLSYTLNYRNDGRSATGVVLTETVPANTTFSAGASTVGWTCAPNNNAGSTCTFSVGNLASLASGSVTYAVTTIDPVAAGLTQISNTATIADDGANGTELHVADNTATDTTPVNAQPDLTVTKTDGGATVSPGGTVTYTLNYANNGNQGATGVVLTETVPANTTFNAGASSPGWSCAPNNNAGSTCTLAVGALNGGGASGSAAFAVTVVNPVAAGVTQISNTASVADDGANGVDPTPANNSGSDTTPVIAAPDLTVTKSDGGTTTIPGGTVAYTLSYSNIGNQGATGVVLTETVPANTTFNAGSSTGGWTCVPNNNAGSTCTLSIGGLNGGGAAGTATFAVTVDTTGLIGVTQISNTATIADDGANGADTNPGNNPGSDTTPRLCQTINVTNPAVAGGLIGLPFSQTFTQSGSFGGSTFTTASTLPNGLTLSSSGVLSGTPTEIGTFPIVVTVTDGNGCSGTSATYNLQITCNVNPVVTNNSDNAVDSLRYAVATACSAPGQNTVTFQPGRGAEEGTERPEATDVTSPIVLTSGEIFIDSDIIIDGPGASVLTISGNNNSRIFRVGPTVNASIDDLTLTNGNGAGGLGSGNGGALYVNGTLSLTRMVVTGNSANNAGAMDVTGGATVTLTDSTISNNTAPAYGGIVLQAFSNTTIRRSTISGNTATGAAALNSGALSAGNSTVVIENSTISGNSCAACAPGSAGGMVFGTTGLTITNSTITNNTPPTGGGGAGGVVVALGTIGSRSTIIAGNVNNAVHPDVLGTFASSGYNLIGNVGAATGFTQPTDQVGGGLNPIINPHLAPLADNGGPTRTHALCFGVNVPQAGCAGLSTALDRGRDFVGSGFDQRGNGPSFVRPFDLPDGTFPNAAGGDGSDIGSFESNNTPPTLTAAATSRQEGSPSANSQVATAGDIETPVGDLSLTVNGGTAPVTVNGVTVTLTDSNAGSAGVNPTAAGAVFADVVAACGATTATFTLTVTDGGGLSTNATLTVTVTPNSAPTLTYNNPASVVFGQSGITVNPATGPTDNGAVTTIQVQSTGTFTGNVSVNAAGVVQISNAAPVGVHTITIRATDNCGAQTLATFQLTVNKANSQTTVQPVVNPSVYGDTVQLTASLTAGAPGAGTPQGTVSFLDGASPIAGCQNLNLNSFGSVTCTTTAPLPAGVRNITANYSGNANFNPSSGTTTQTVNKKSLNITASSHTVTYGDAAPAVTSTITGFIAGEGTGNLTTQPTCSTTYTQGSGVAGSPYPTSCSGAAAANYQFNYINGTVLVNKKALSLTAENKSRAYGAANPALTFTTSGFIAGDNLANSTTGSPGLSTTATATSPVGTYPITITQGTLASANYSIGPLNNGTLTVTGVQLTVTAENKTRVFGAANPPLTFTVTGFVNGEGPGNLTGAPNLSTTANAASAPGTYPITITQGTLANPNYTFAFVNGTLTVTGGAATTTTITNAASLSANATTVGQSYAVNWSVQPVPPASGTPTGNVTVTDGTGATCTAPVAAGTCSLTSTTVGVKTITATYAGDANFAGSTSSPVQHNVIIGISGNVKQFVPFGTNTNLEGVTITLTNTTINQSTTATTDANGNYAFGVAVSGNNFVVTPSGLGKIYEPISRTYANVTTSITNADFVAYNAPGPGGIPREVRVVNTVANAGSPVTVPIDVTSQANETRFEFSLSFDNALLGIPTVACGTNTTGCTVTVNTSVPGRAGVTISSFPALTAGAREIARVTFPTSLNTATATPVNFADQPTVRDVRDANNNPLPAIYRTGFVSFTSDLEGDVVSAAGTPPGGDGVLANDVTIVRQMALGLILPTAGQYRNADAAPRSTLGDGCPINATDVTQAGRYALGIDPPTAAGGPAAPNPGLCTPPTFAEEPQAVTSSRIIRAVTMSGQAGSRVNLEIRIDAAGNEAAASFTVNFDPSKMRYAEAKLTAGVPDGTTLALNTQQTMQGKLGVLFDSSNAFRAGTTGVMTIAFDILPNATGSTAVTFTDDLAARNVSNQNAEPIAATFTGGSINVTTAAERTIRGRVTTPSGQGLRNAQVILIAPDGTRRTAVTSSFGLYEFTQVAEGQNTVTVTSRRYRFTPRQITPTDTVTTIDFVGLE
jgi:uncharacterized repeat protein (TIGR01451 family)